MNGQENCRAVDHLAFPRHDRLEARPMSPPTGETTHLLARLRLGDEQARNQLISHCCARLRRLASRMLKEYPGVRRWEQTDDVLQNASIRLYRALETERPESSLHFQRLASLQIRRELIDMARHYAGPQGHGANYHTDGAGRAKMIPVVLSAGRSIPAVSRPRSLNGRSSLNEWRRCRKTKGKCSICFGSKV